MSRPQAREFALNLLFQYEFDRDFELGTSSARFIQNFGVPSEVAEYGKPLISGILQNLTEIDSAIQAASAHWKIARMSTVDRNALRIGAFELLYMNQEVPPKVAINEAIEIGKRFGNAESGGFINGLLDQVARSKGLI